MHSGKEGGVRWVVMLSIPKMECFLKPARGWERSTRDSKQSAVLDHDK